MFGATLLLGGALVVGEAAEDRDAALLSLGAGVAGAGTVGWIFFATSRQIANREDVAESEFGGPWFPSWVVHGPPIAVFGLSAEVLAALAGDAWGIHHHAEGTTLSRRSARGYVAGGVVLRLVGLGLLVGTPFVVNRASACPFDDPAFVACMRGNYYGAAALGSAGAVLRWTGAGMLMFGLRHGRNRRATLSPGVLGVSGRF
jgi:hypothetical protein